MKNNEKSKIKEIQKKKDDWLKVQKKENNWLRERRQYAGIEQNEDVDSEK